MLAALCRALPRFALVLLLAAAACGPGAFPPPRFGSLEATPRTFRFRHDIRLATVSDAMMVAVVQDERTNLVTVDVRYKVGFADDPPGRGGMAHLVEHLLFQPRREPGGPTLWDELFVQALEFNAHTTAEETHYSSTAPVDRLDALIELEARRLRTICDQLDDASFARERDVVKLEERLRANSHQDLFDAVLASLYGRDHAYARDTTEIAAATRAEACAFIDAHYTLDRAIVVITGPVDPDQTIKKVGRAFGPIGKRSKAKPAAVAGPRLDGATDELTAPVLEPTALVFLPLPAWGTDGRQAAQAGSGWLGYILRGKADERSWIEGVGINLVGGVTAPALMVAVTVNDDDRLDDAVALVREAIREAADQMGRLDARELAGLVGSLQMEVVADWDRLDRRGSWIADYLQYTRHLTFLVRDLEQLDALTAARLAAAARGWTPQQSRVLLVRPSGEAAAAGALRTLPANALHEVQTWRTPVDLAEATRPLTAETVSLAGRVRAFDLANGLRVVLAPDPQSPIVEARLVFAAGRAQEPADRPGLASLTAELLAHDVERRFPPAALRKLLFWRQLGTQTGATTDETTTTFWARGLSSHGDWHLWELSWLLDQGVHPADALAARHKRLRAALADVSDDDEQDARAHRRFRARLYGAGHPYAAARDPQGSLAIKRGDLDRWRRQRYRPDGATLILSGAFEPAAMRHLAEELFGSWPTGVGVDEAAVAQARPPVGPHWLAVADEHGQPSIRIGFPVRSELAGDEAARRVLRAMIQDRLWILREQKGATYTPTVGLDGGARGQALILDVAVDAAALPTVLSTILADLERLRGGGSDLTADFVRARRRALGQALQHTGGALAMADALEHLAAHKLPYTHAEQVARAITQLTPEQVLAVARQDLAAEHAVVELRGPADVVKATFASLGVTPAAGE